MIDRFRGNFPRTPLSKLAVFLVRSVPDRYRADPEWLRELIVGNEAGSGIG